MDGLTLLPPRPEAEILTHEWVEIVASPRGFDPVTSRVVTRVPAGLSVAEMTARIEPNPVRRRAMLAYIGAPCRDNYLPRAWHHRVRPHGGQRVHLIAPMGDDDFFRIFVQLAALSVAVFVPAPFGPFLAFGLVLGVNALIPPPRQDTSEAEALRRRPLVTGFRNRLDPWGVIPRPLGKVRITPPFLAEPYRFTRGEHQWFSLIFAVRGPVELEDFRFGKTSVDRFKRVEVRYTGGYPESPLDFTASDIAPDSNRIRLAGHPYVRGNEVRFRTSGGTLDSALAAGTRYWVVSSLKNAIKVSESRGGKELNLKADGSGTSTVFRRERRPRLYPGQVFPDEFNITLEEDVRHVRTTPAEIDRSSVIFFFPRGLGKFDDKDPGDLDPQTVQVEVQFTETGTSNWRPADQESFPARTSPRMRNPTLAPDAIVLNPHTGALQVLQLPFPPNRIPIALITRNSLDNDKIQETEITDMRPSVADTKFPPGVRFAKPIDFKPRPTSPPSNRIRIRRGTLKSLALLVVAKSRDPFFRTVDLEFPERGQYDVRVKRTNSAGGEGVFDEVVFASLTSFRNDAPISMEARKKGVSIIEVKARASENLEGVLDQFNCLATSVLQDWDGEDWVWRATDNHASVLRGILQGPGNPTPVPDSRLILEDFQEYHEWCEARNFRFGQEVNFPSNVLDMARDAAATGRAAIANADLKYGLAIDRMKSARVTDFGPHTIIRDSLEVTLNYGPKLHGLRGRFRNRRKDYVVDEIVVYGTGFDESNADPARIQALDLPGVTRAKHAGRYLQYRLLDLEQRRGKLYSFELGLQNLQIRVGDLVGLNSDVAFLGLGSGRAIAIATAGGNTTGATLSSPVLMVAGTDYEARVVKADGTLVALDVDTVPGESPVLTFTTPPLIADGPAVDELVLFGELGKAVAPVVIRSIAPTSPYRARVTAVDLAPGIFTIDGEPEPEFSSFVTIPPGLGRPAVLGVASDERAVELQHDGAYNLGILVALRQPAALSFAADRLEAQIRVEPEPADDGGQSDEEERAEWTPLAPLPVDTLSVRFGAVRTGETYQMRFRYNGPDGPGDWTATVVETVVGIATPPPDVTDLTVDRGALSWLYPDPPRDLAGFLLRVHFGAVFDWGSAIPLHPQDRPVTGPPFAVGNLDRTGPRTLMVKGVDVAGNQSVNPGSILYDFGEPVFANIVLQTDYHPTFPGSITNGTVTGGKLEATPTGGHWPGADEDAAYWRADPLYPIWQVQYPKLTYDADFTPNKRGALAVQVGADAPDGYEVLLRRDLVAPLWFANESVTVWPGADDDALWWDTKAGQFFQAPGRQDLEVEDHTIRICTPASARKATIETLSAVLDVEDIKERLAAVAIGSAGTTRLPTAKDWDVITEVFCAIQSVGGENAVSYKVIDQDPSGPLVQTFNAAGSLADGTVNATIIGYLE